MNNDSQTRKEFEAMYRRYGNRFGQSDTDYALERKECGKYVLSRTLDAFYWWSAARERYAPEFKKAECPGNAEYELSKNETELYDDDALGDDE